jgi:phosphate transport system protein
MPWLEKELDGLREKMLLMAGYAMLAVNKAVDSHVRRDDDLAWQVDAEDDELDRLELEIDELAVQLLARAPLACDLRLITAAMRISHELERVGDEATAIARRARELSEEPPLQESAEISQMAGMGLKMIGDALDAFVERVPAKARAVIPRDRELDALNKQFHSKLRDRILADPSTLARCLNLMCIARRLERIGDHAKRLAEEVVYLYEGRDIRHSAMRLAEAS